MNSPVVVFQSKSKYGWLLILIPIVVFVQIFVQLGFAIAKDDSVEKDQEIITFVITLLSLALLFGFILPSRFEVLSDSSINVVTLLGKAWNFSEATEAYRLESIWSDLSRPKWKFGTSLEATYRIAVRRGGRKWDLLVSPAEPEEFMRVINESKPGSTLSDETEGLS